jgi:hypothetical protein
LTPPKSRGPKRRESTLTSIAPNIRTATTPRQLSPPAASRAAAIDPAPRVVPDADPAQTGDSDQTAADSWIPSRLSSCSQGRPCRDRRRAGGVIGSTRDQAGVTQLVDERIGVADDIEVHDRPAAGPADHVDDLMRPPDGG